MSHVEYTAAIFYGIPLWGSIRQLLTLCEEFWEEGWNERKHLEWEQTYGSWFDDKFQLKRDYRSEFEWITTKLFNKINAELASQDIPAHLAQYDIPKYSRRINQPFLCIKPSHHEISIRGAGDANGVQFEVDPIVTSEWDKQLKVVCKREGIRWVSPTFWLTMQVPLDGVPYAKFFYEVSVPPVPEPVYDFDGFDFGDLHEIRGLPSNIADQSHRSSEGLTTFTLPMTVPNPWNQILRDVCERYALSWVAPQFHLLLSYTA